MMHDIFIPYLKNKDGTLRRDSLGRRIHINQKNNGGRRSQGLVNVVMVKMDNEMKAGVNKLAKRDKISMAAKIREFIEWGLEQEGKG